VSLFIVKALRQMHSKQLLRDGSESTRVREIRGHLIREVRRLPQLGTGTRVAIVAVTLAALSSPQLAAAVPSFARQTGMPCSQCHSASFGPALTAYGRQFKLNGYTWGDANSQIPVALMLQGGYSRTDAAQPSAPVPHYSPNDNVSLDQASLFLGTRLTEHLGVFAQGTYSGERRAANWDNTDVRYARQVSLFGTDAVVGVSVNNNPTVQDLWNSTPAWGFPYITSPLVPSPGASPIINGALAQLVLGATAYTMIHDRLYLEAGLYRGLSSRWLGNLGVAAPATHLDGVIPYWRAAYQLGGDVHYFSVGTFGLDAKIQPDPSVPQSNRYTDVGLDATYQYVAGPTTIFADASVIHEHQGLGASFAAGSANSPSEHLDQVRLDVSYVFQQTWSAGVGLFDVRGAADPTLYSAAPLTGSNNGSPNSRGYILQLEAIPLGKMSSWGRPWVNIRLGVQFTGYLRFNGGVSNYDGFGRSAAQNNSLFVFSWMAF